MMLDRTTGRRLAMTALVGLPLGLLAPVAVAQGAQTYLPAKKTVYSYVDDEPLFTGSVRIKVGADKKKITRATVKVSCPDGDDTVVFKNLPYRPASLGFRATKGKSSNPTHEFQAQFPTKKAAVGSLALYDGPCDGYLFSFVAYR